MEYRLNVLGALKWFGHREKITQWTTYKVKYAMENWIEFTNYKDSDVQWWLTQLNNKGE